MDSFMRGTFNLPKVSTAHELNETGLFLHTLFDILGLGLVYGKYL